MYNFIQRNKKKMLAVFGVLLMVAFTLPTQNLGGGGGADAAWGFTSARTITRGEVADARNGWELLKRQMTFLPEAGQFVPYIYRLDPAPSQGPFLVQQIEQHPDLYVLLQEEARQTGLAISDDRLKEAIDEDPFLRPETVASPEFRRALRDFLLVQSYVGRLSSAVKPSTPLVQRFIDSQTLQLRVNLAEVTAAQFKPADAISDADLQAHFAKYVRSAARAPATGPATTPTTAAATKESLSFDYKYPDRVKFQYLVLDVKQLRDVVRKTKDEHRWEVEARKYYQQHQDEFPARPATLPASLLPPSATAPAQGKPAETKPAAAVPAPAPAPAATGASPAVPKPPAAEETELEPRTAVPVNEGDAILAADVQPAAAGTKPAGSAPVAQPAATATVSAATSPSVRPFVEVKEQILQRIMEPEVKKLAAQLSDKVAQRLTADFAAYRKAKPAIAETGGYPSSEYLERVATDIEKEHKVRPTVVSKAVEWTGVNDLSKVEGLGTASAGQDRVDDVAKQLDALGGKTLTLLEFARPLTDFNGSVYFVRFTEADKTHEPASLAEVKPRVEEDVRTLRGFEAAKAAAAKMLGDAEMRGLAAAAAAGKAKFTATGPFDRSHAQGRGMFTPIQGFEEADPFAKSEMVVKAYELMQKASAATPKPKGLLELPEQRKVLVIELADVASPLKEDQALQAMVDVRSGLAARDAEALVMSYLSYDAIKARLGYRLDRPAEEEHKDEQKKPATGAPAQR